jgi:hypothetical protein
MSQRVKFGVRSSENLEPSPVSLVPPVSLDRDRDLNLL